MARMSPEEQIARIKQTIRAWETDAPHKTFSRRTLAQFKQEMQPCLEAHARVLEMRKNLRIGVIERNGLVKKALQLVYMIGHAVKGDPDHGANSDLTEALGYTREIARRAKIRRAARRRRAKRM